MNVPPESGVRISPQELRALVATLFEKAGTSREHAELMAHLMVQTEQRGIFSHGSQYTSNYVHMMLEGRVNPRPNIRVVSETTTAQVLDGDGGMGHFPCYQGTQWAIARSKEHGTAAVTTRNHSHFGGASKYTRMALEHDCIGLAISSNRYPLDPEQSVLAASVDSPLSIAIPAGEQPPLVPDMGLKLLHQDPDLFAQNPWAYFKELGLGAAAQALGGILAGIYKSEFPGPAVQVGVQPGRLHRHLRCRQLHARGRAQTRDGSLHRPGPQHEAGAQVRAGRTARRSGMAAGKRLRLRGHPHRPQTPEIPGRNSRRAGGRNPLRALRAHPFWSLILI